MPTGMDALADRDGVVEGRAGALGWVVRLYEESRSMVKTRTVGMHLLDLVIISVVLVAPSTVSAQTTPWGDPDLQGVWTNQTPTPVERPEGLGEFFTEAEAVDFEQTSLERLLGLFAPGGPLAAEAELSGELSDIWLETQDGKVAPSRRTSLVADPPRREDPLHPGGQRAVGSEADRHEPNHLGRTSGRWPGGPHR